MQEWLNTQLANGLPAFAGSSLSGTLAVREELATELLNEMLRETAAAQRRTASGSTAGISSVAQLVKSVAVRAEAGTVMIDFRIAV